MKLKNHQLGNGATAQRILQNIPADGFSSPATRNQTQTSP